MRWKHVSPVPDLGRRRNEFSAELRSRLTKLQIEINILNLELPQPRCGETVKCLTAIGDPVIM